MKMFPALVSAMDITNLGTSYKIKMTQRMSRASRTVARALQMMAASAVSRGLEAVDAIFTRLTLLAQCGS